MQNTPKKTHTESTTTVRANANYWPFSCVFFCNRTTNSDVIDQSKSSKKEDEKSTMLDTKIN